MKNKFLLREEFMVWLITIGKYPIPSAKSYCSYVAAADKVIIYVNEENTEESNLFARLEPEVRKGNWFKVDAIIVETINFLVQDRIEKITNAPISSIQKWKSGLNQYRDFLYNYIETEIETDDIAEDIDMINEVEEVDTDEDEGIVMTFDENIKIRPDVKYTYSKQDLYANFRFRLITQDRIYDEIYYPISFIKRFFYLKGDKDFLDEWVKSLLDKVVVHLKDSSITLNQLRKLEIVNGGIYIDINGVSQLAFTKKSNNTELTPFLVAGLKKVALDHEKPLFKIMQENIGNLITFKEITKELKKQIKRRVNPKRLKKASNIVLKSSFIDLINIEKLKSEMVLISTLSHLQLMDGAENKRKGASYTPIININ